MPSVYEVITARIVEKLEAGTVPWHKPWSAETGTPRNPTLPWDQYLFTWLPVVRLPCVGRLPPPLLRRGVDVETVRHFGGWSALGVVMQYVTSSERVSRLGHRPALPPEPATVIESDLPTGSRLWCRR